jgi:endonuclease/exonuclease/phosphatase family metal-dependent hydrolase
MSFPSAVMAGDFNAGVRWDAKSHHPFKALESTLERRGFRSAVHVANDWRFGDEAQPTSFDRSREDAKFHIDYVFSNQLRSRSVSATVGAKDEWRRHSDHMPVIVDLGNLGSA